MVILLLDPNKIDANLYQILYEITLVTFQETFCFKYLSVFFQIEKYKHVGTLNCEIQFKNIPKRKV